MTIQATSTDNLLDRKIRCACRRGLLELDVLLNHFLATEYLSLDNAERTLFLTMLGESDTELLSWVTQPAACPQPSYQDILVKLRSIR